MKTPCTHGRTLQKGLLCDRGYLFIRIDVKGRRYQRGFGPHTTEIEKIAIMILNQINEKRYFGNFEFPTEQGRKRFSDLCDIFYKFAFERNPKRSESSRYNCRVRMNQFKAVWGSRWADAIDGSDILKWRAKREKEVKFSTVNRDQRILSSVFNTVRKLISTKQIPSFQLPTENPCSSVVNPSEEALSRDRVPSKEEMKAAKSWCFEHDRSLWDIVELAVITARRKGELMRLKPGAPIIGIQTKTGKKFKLPMVLEAPLNWVNFDDRFDVLRKAMGWFHKEIDGVPNDLYTVFHDLKHYGPTSAGEQGFSGPMVNAYTQHSDPKMAQRYTNPRTVKQVTDAVTKEIKDL